MKIFVTVGTTKFDTLVEFLDKNLDNSYEVLFQISDGDYIPKNFPYIIYSDDINSLYNEYDYIITHAGAGTIYKLLDLNKKFIVVPNLDRIDQHQTDIANFIDINGYAISCNDFKDILQALKLLPKKEFIQYEKYKFFKTKEICQFIRESLSQ
jgi:beta-1,4-N-acetylglucosaminyltransferase